MLFIRSIANVLSSVWSKRAGFYYIEKTRAWHHNQIRRPQATVKFSFDIGSVTSSEGDGEHSNIETPWPSSLIGKNICYDVPLASKTTGINLRELIRKVTVKIAGKRVIDTESEEQVPENNSMRLLNHVDVHFRRGRMACLMGTSGKEQEVGDERRSADNVLLQFHVVSYLYSL